MLVQVREKKNEVTLRGTLKWKKDVTETKKGAKRCAFAVDTGKDDRPNCVPCVAWEAAAETLDDMKDGDPVEVRGWIRHASYSTDDGGRRWLTEVNAQDVGRAAGGGDFD